MNLKIIFSILFSIGCYFANSQVKIGQWVDHLSYNSANSLAKVGNVIYFSNGKGLAKYNTSDNSSEKLTKINGLSDVNIKLIRKCSYNDYLLVIYENTNMDIIKPDGTIINISDIKRKSVTGKKNINEVYFNGQFAYLACGFGIVVFDFNKLEVKDTYYIGSAFKNYGIYQITKNDTAFVVASDSGIFYGKFVVNLTNPLNWKSLNTGLVKGPYNSIINVNGNLFTNYSEIEKSGQFYKDTIYQFTSANTWVKLSCYLNQAGATNKKLYQSSDVNKFFVSSRNLFSEMDISGAITNSVSSNAYRSIINDVYHVGGNDFWFADELNGLINRKITGGTNVSTVIKINGPENNYVNDIGIKDGKLVIAPVNLSNVYTNQFIRPPSSYFEENEWRSLEGIIPDSIMDVNSVAIDPNDKNHIAFACMGSGVVELKNNVVKGVYTNKNSPLSAYMYNNTIPFLWVTGLNFDNNSNLWNLVSWSPYIIQVLKKDGTWHLLDFSQFTYFNTTVSKVIFTKNNQAWVILARDGGVLIYSDVNGLSAPNASNTKVAKIGVGIGNLPTSDVPAICEDLDGKIWIGTQKGVAVFYNPENVFTGANWDCQQILIEQDGNVQNLLEDDKVNAVAVDGANRKWIGTENSGVYCFSPDGQNEIYHFTFENSPLYSNAIRDIVTDETTGDVFIASEAGIQSFRTPIIKGFDNFSKVHAYPNPVRPGTSNTVYVKGLVDEAIVKITDVAGNLIWETKAQGGQIQWNLQNFRNEKVVSGTYLINCSTANGELKGTTKLLVVN